jgi:hypothetical protein
MTTESHKPGWRRLRLHPVIWLVLILPVFAWAQLTYPGYFELHSGFLPIFNLNSLMRGLTDLGWAPTIGQPYDLLRGERVLPYLLAALPRLLGASSAAAVKWVFGASILAGALGMYGWARRRLGPWPALVASAVYALWPLGLATVYVRGAFAEALLLGLMPWVLWAADAALASGRPGTAVGLGLGIAATFWTQVGLALWLSALVLVYIIVLGRSSTAERAPAATAGSRQRISNSKIAVLGWLGGLALGILGLLPLILSQGLGGSTRVVFGDHVVYPYQLMASNWGMGTSIPGPYDTLTFQLGLIACSLAVFSFLGLRSHPPDGAETAGDATRGDLTSIAYTHHAIRTTQYVALAFVLILSFLSSTLAAPLWQALPALARTLTYPWQLLLLTGPWLAWLAGLGGWALIGVLPEGRFEAGQILISAGLVVLVVLGSYSYLAPTTLSVPIPEAPLAIFGDDEIALLSAVTAGRPGPGGQITALVRWQALRPLDRDYTVFFHAVGPDGTLWGQEDTMPQGGALPTSQWRAGQVVSDQYQILLKPDAPATDGYTYPLGLYQWQTGERLSTGTDDKVVLTP